MDKEQTLERIQELDERLTGTIERLDEATEALEDLLGTLCLGELEDELCELREEVKNLRCELSPPPMELGAVLRFLCKVLVEWARKHDYPGYADITAGELIEATKVSEDWSFFRPLAPEDLPIVCQAMRMYKIEGDQILSKPPERDSLELTIRYMPTDYRVHSEEKKFSEMAELVRAYESKWHIHESVFIR